MPAPVTFLPFHVNGTALEHTVVSLLVMICGVTITFRFTTEEQRAVEGSVALTMPATVTFLPFHVNGTALEHTVVSLLVMICGVTITFRFTTESQPAFD